jgi:hypothetical protein
VDPRYTIARRANRFAPVPLSTDRALGRPACGTDGERHGPGDEGPDEPTPADRGGYPGGGLLRPLNPILPSSSHNGRQYTSSREGR